jgi:aspartate/methionine/tyrosine aminotransferase
LPSPKSPGLEMPVTAISHLASLRPEALAAPESGIVELFNYGRGRQGLLPLWVGEGDLPTPEFIRRAAADSFAAGETFYTHQRGLPETREAISRYMTRHYGTQNGPDSYFVTVGGMHALQIAVRLVAGVGDEVLVVTPGWPNFAGSLAAAGASAVDVPLHLQVRPAGGLQWALDLDRMAASVSRKTRAIVVNSPGNPTGWTASLAELEGILALARDHGLWIIADEIYGRLTYDAPRAPSFHDLADESDRILYIQTLSKNWAMTGWRIGWLEAPSALGQVIENLIQYSTSGVAVPIQRGAIAALDQGEPFVSHQLARFRQSRDILCGTLEATGRVRFAEPEGAFYLFAAIEGEADSTALAKRLVDEAGVGVAPGNAFGPGGEDHLRLCFACSPERTTEAAIRLVHWLGR